MQIHTHTHTQACSNAYTCMHSWTHTHDITWNSFSSWPHIFQCSICIPEVLQTHNTTHQNMIWHYDYFCLYALQLRGRFLSVITAAGSPMVGTPIGWSDQRHNLDFTVHMLFNGKGLERKVELPGMKPRASDSIHIRLLTVVTSYECIQCQNTSHLIRSTVSQISCICSQKYWRSNIWRLHLQTWKIHVGVISTH